MSMSFLFFFFNDTATTEIYTLSLHDALPICGETSDILGMQEGDIVTLVPAGGDLPFLDLTGKVDVGGLTETARTQVEVGGRSEEHTSELQSRQYLVCRLLLEKKKINIHILNK